MRKQKHRNVFLFIRVSTFIHSEVMKPSIKPAVSLYPSANKNSINQEFLSLIVTEFMNKMAETELTSMLRGEVVGA